MTTTLCIEFNLVSSLKTDQSQFLQQAFETYQNVLNELPPFPVLLLNKDKGEFTPEKCIVAHSEQDVLGCALFTKIGRLTPMLGAIGEKFGDEAAYQMDRVENRLNPRYPIYEIGSISVPPFARNQGIGRSFFEFAKNHSHGNVFAIINAENKRSQKAALSAGYRPIPDSCHGVRFSLDGQHAKPDRQGYHLAKAEVFCPL